MNDNFKICQPYETILENRRKKIKSLFYEIGVGLSFYFLMFLIFLFAVILN